MENRNNNTFSVSTAMIRSTRNPKNTMLYATISRETHKNVRKRRLKTLGIAEMVEENETGLEVYSEATVNTTAAVERRENAKRKMR